MATVRMGMARARTSAAGKAPFAVFVGRIVAVGEKHDILRTRIIRIVKIGGGARAAPMRVPEASSSVMAISAGRCSGSSP